MIQKFKCYMTNYVHRKEVAEINSDTGEITGECKSFYFCLAKMQKLMWSLACKSNK